jgi:hypothetical protein
MAVGVTYDNVTNGICREPDRNETTVFMGAVRAPIALAETPQQLRTKPPKRFAVRSDREGHHAGFGIIESREPPVGVNRAWTAYDDRGSSFW